MQEVQVVEDGGRLHLSLTTEESHFIEVGGKTFVFKGMDTLEILTPAAYERLKRNLTLWQRIVAVFRP